MSLTYDKGLSKYAVTKTLFPDDSYTHRLKRLQRAARFNVWAVYFDIADVMLSHDNNGSYIVGRLVPKDMTIVVNGTVNVSHFRFLKRALMFDHELTQRRRPQPRTWMDVFTSFVRKLVPF